MGPCHSEKPLKNVEDGKINHLRGCPTLLNHCPPAKSQQRAKPKILFNLLVSDDSEQSNGYAGLDTGTLKAFDDKIQDGSIIQAGNSFHHSFSDGFLRFNSGSNSDTQTVSLQHLESDPGISNGMDLDHMEKVEMTRNKLEILLSDRTTPHSIYSSSPGIAKSYSEPITPPPLRSDLGKRNNSEGSQYQAFVLKKRQSNAVLSPTSKEWPLSLEDTLIKSKRKKSGQPNFDDQNSKITFDLPNKIICSTEIQTPDKNMPLLKKILSGTADDESEYANMSDLSGCDNSNMLYDKKSLSNLDLSCSSTSIPQSTTSFQVTVLYSKHTPSTICKKRVSGSVRLAESAKESLLIFLCKAIRYAWCLPDFLQLPNEDKFRMLVKAAPRLVLLEMAMENFQLEASPLECESDETDFISEPGLNRDHPKPSAQFVESLKMFITRCQLYKITETESNYLKLITLYQYSDSKDPLQTGEKVKTSLLQAFKELRDLTIENKSRYGQLLMQVYSLFFFDLKTLETLFLQPLLGSQGDESLQKLKRIYRDGGAAASVSMAETKL